jgi:hypothetical protein
MNSIDLTRIDRGRVSGSVDCRILPEVNFHGFICTGDPHLALVLNIAII